MELKRIRSVYEILKYIEVYGVIFTIINFTSILQARQVNLIQSFDPPRSPSFGVMTG